MNARTEAIQAVTPLCERLGDRLAEKSGGVFDADDAASDMKIGAIQCYDKIIEDQAFDDEAAIISAVANAVHRDYQDMLKKTTSLDPDDVATVAGKWNRQSRSSLQVTKDPADAVAAPVDVTLQIDMEAKLAAMDGIDDEICHRLMDGENKAAICRDLKLTPYELDRRIESIRVQLRELNEPQDMKGSE